MTGQLLRGYTPESLGHKECMTVTADRLDGQLQPDPVEVPLPTF
jgi:hypothetical protein